MKETNISEMTSGFTGVSLIDERLGGLVDGPFNQPVAPEAFDP